MEGYGRYEDKDGRRYEGYFQWGSYNGEGVFTDNEQNMLKGTFRGGKLFSGMLTLADGTAIPVEEGKLADETVLEKLPEITREPLTPEKKKK